MDKRFVFTLVLIDGGVAVDWTTIIQDFLLIKRQVVHSGKTQGAPSEVIEVFAPVREDLMRD